MTETTPKIKNRTVRKNIEKIWLHGCNDIDSLPDRQNPKLKRKRDANKRVYTSNVDWCGSASWQSADVKA